MRKTVLAAAMMLGLPLAAHAAPTHWKGTADGMQTDIKLNPATGTVKIDGASSNCFGSVEGKAEHTPTGMKLVTGTGSKRCEITMNMDKAGNITGGGENMACMEFHGASCSFDALTGKVVR